MSMLAKIGSYIKTSLLPLPRSLEIQDEKISQISQTKICKICLCDTSLDKIQTLQHKTNLNCVAHKKKYVCLDCASRIKIKKCPFCRGQLSNPKQDLCITILRRFTHLDALDTMDESLEERLVCAVVNSVTIGMIMGSVAGMFAIGEGVALNYGYVLNHDTCKTIVYTLLGSGFPLGAIYGFISSSVISLPFIFNDPF
jgi:hypothetical protein